jgi:hypothetical protein
MRESCYTRKCRFVERPETLSELRARTGTEPEPDWHLFGRKPVLYELQEERPWHRIAAYFFATGATTIKQVADACEVNKDTMRNLLRQPWFQERVTKLLAENGGKDILSLLRSEQINCLIVMTQLRDDKNTPAAVKAGICRDILDRTLGKAIQRIETSDTTFSDDPVAEARQLKEQLARQKEGE